MFIGTHPLEVWAISSSLTVVLKRVDGDKGSLAFLALFRESFFRFKLSITKSAASLARPSWSTVPQQFYSTIPKHAGELPRHRLKVGEALVILEHSIAPATNELGAHTSINLC